jgi:aspartyl/asparaginyl beta-hydroxylase (cupin superfamily)
MYTIYKKLAEPMAFHWLSCLTKEQMVIRRSYREITALHLNNLTEKTVRKILLNYFRTCLAKEAFSFTLYLKDYNKRMEDLQKNIKNHAARVNQNNIEKKTSLMRLI